MMTIPYHVLHTVVLVFSVIDMILFPVPNLPVIPPPFPLSLCGQPWPTPAWVWLQSICFLFLPLYEPSRLAATADALTDRVQIQLIRLLSDVVRFSLSLLA
jgi:hypothetical protein